MEIKELIINRKNRKRLFWTVASVVVFVTTYMLVLPALTIDEDTAIKDPGISNETLDQDTVNEFETVADPFTIEQEREEALNNTEETNTTDSSTVDSFNAQNTEIIETVNDSGTFAEGSADEDSILSNNDSDLLLLEDESAIKETEKITADGLIGDGKTLTITLLADDSIKLPENAVLEVNEIEFDDPEWNSRSYWLASALSEKYGNVTISDARFLSVRIMSGDQEYKPKSPVKLKIEFTEKLINEDTAEYYYDEEAGRELRPDPEDQVSHFAVINYTDNGTEFLTASIKETNNGIDESIFEAIDLSKIDIVYVYEYTASLAD